MPLLDLGIPFKPHKQAVFVDGHYLMHRILHLPRMAALATPDGTPTGGVYGFLRSLRLSLAALHGFNRCVVAYDGGSSVRRRALCPEYRVREQPKEPVAVGREGVEEGMSYLDLFIDQSRATHLWLRNMGISQIRLRRREADDILYRLTLEARQEGLRSIIVSDDKDFLQLLSDDVHVFRPMAEQYVTPESFRAEYGFPPRRYLLFKALCGDPSDKVKGVVGVGEKTAAEVVKHCKKAREIPTWCSEQKGGRLNFKAAGSEDAQAVVKRNVKLFDMSLEEFDEDEERKIRRVYRQRIPRDLDKIKQAAEELHFDTIASNLGLWISPFRWCDKKSSAKSRG